VVRQEIEEAAPVNYDCFTEIEHGTTAERKWILTFWVADTVEDAAEQAATFHDRAPDDWTPRSVSVVTEQRRFKVKPRPSVLVIEEKV
jgi:hypothetical protein